MLDWISPALGQLQQSKVLLGVTMILVFGLGIVLTMIGGEIRNMIHNRRVDRWEEEAELEAQRVREWCGEENSDEWDLTKDTYHGRYASQKEQRTLTQEWRELVSQAAYRSGEWPQFNEQTVEWPAWTEEQRAIPGRHRYDDTQVVEAKPVSPGQSYTPQQLRALVTPTGAMPVVRPKELVGVGQ